METDRVESDASVQRGVESTSADQESMRLRSRNVDRPEFSNPRSRRCIARDESGHRSRASSGEDEEDEPEIANQRPSNNEDGSNVHEHEDNGQGHDHTCESGNNQRGEANLPSSMLEQMMTMISKLAEDIKADIKADNAKNLADIKADIKADNAKNLADNAKNLADIKADIKADNAKNHDSLTLRLDKLDEKQNKFAQEMLELKASHQAFQEKVCSERDMWQNQTLEKVEQDRANFEKTAIDTINDKFTVMEIQVNTKVDGKVQELEKCLDNTAELSRSLEERSTELGKIIDRQSKELDENDVQRTCASNDADGGDCQNEQARGVPGSSEEPFQDRPIVVHSPTTDTVSAYLHLSENLVGKINARDNDPIEFHKSVKRRFERRGPSRRKFIGVNSWHKPKAKMKRLSNVDGRGKHCKFREKNSVMATYANAVYGADVL